MSKYKENKNKLYLTTFSPFKDEDQNTCSKAITRASSSPPKIISLSERLRALKEKKIAAQRKVERRTTPIQVPKREPIHKYVQIDYR